MQSGEGDWDRTGVAATLALFNALMCPAEAVLHAAEGFTMLQLRSFLQPQNYGMPSSHWAVAW